MKLHPCWLALFFGGWTLIGAAAAAETIFPPGLRIGIEPPPGMTLNRTSGQFEDVDRNATLTILDLPARLYNNLEQAIFAEIGAPGVTIEARQSFPFTDGIGFFTAVRLTVDGVRYKKWILLATSASNLSPDLVTVVSVQVPVKALDAYPDAAVRAALKTVVFRPAPNEERLGLLPFKIGEFSGFKIAHVAPYGVVLIDGPDSQSGHPEIAISIAPGEARTPDDRANISRQAFATAGLAGVNVLNSEAQRIGGSPGYEIRATARLPNGAAITVVQWIRFAGNRLLRIFAAARTEEWDKMFPRFRAVRDGIEFR